jgi:hypothetical protein
MYLRRRSTEMKDYMPTNEELGDYIEGIFDGTVKLPTTRRDREKLIIEWARRREELKAKMQAAFVENYNHPVKKKAVLVPGTTNVFRLQVPRVRLPTPVLDEGVGMHSCFDLVHASAWNAAVERG